MNRMSLKTLTDEKFNSIKLISEQINFKVKLLEQLIND